MRKSTNEIVAKPFLKWAGGKGQLLERFFSLYPAELSYGEIKNYYEPFVGGGAVFFHIAQQFRIESAFLYDINEELILTYSVIQKDVLKLIEMLAGIKEKYEKLNEQQRKEYFYFIRNEFNHNISKTDFTKYSETWVLRAAQIIFLNKTCFNGLFRFNSKGEFNVPVGAYKNPKILDEQNLLKASEVLKVAIIKRSGFQEVEKDVLPGSFVYFDPPYRPLNPTSSFTSYSKFRFDDNEQRKLAELFKRLDKKGIKLMLSNSDPKNTNSGDDFFDKIYEDFNISRIPATRMINSNATKRNAINELVITNYL